MRGLPCPGMRRSDEVDDIAIRFAASVGHLGDKLAESPVEWSGFGFVALLMI